MLIKKKFNRQKGQSLIYVSILIVVLISGVFFVYDIGNMVNTKIKFQNAADAAALASVALKIGKHHTDALVRTSMYHESIAAQANQRAAQATLFQLLNSINQTLVKPPDGTGIIVNPGPGNPGGTQPAYPDEKQKGLADKYIKYANKTYRHVTKLHRERLALTAYYEWLTGVPAETGSGVGRRATTEAARVAFRANSPGLLSIGNNLKVLTNENDLVENDTKYGIGKIGGIPYDGEGATKEGNFGKTFVQFEGEGASTIQGTSFLKYSSKYVMRTNAAAKIASNVDLGLPPTRLGIPPAQLYMLWYSPRLMSIDNKTNITVLH
jgi:hypothetical protein